MKLPDLPVGWGQAYLIVGAVAAAIVVLRLLLGYEACAFDICLDLDRKFGLILATLAAVGLAFGGFQAFNEEKSGGGSPSQPF